MAKKSDNPPILIYQDWLRFFLTASDKDAGYLIKAVFTKLSGITLESKTENHILETLADFMVDRITQEQLHYKMKCERLAENRKQLKSNENKCNQLKSNEVQNNPNPKNNPKNNPNPKNKNNNSSIEELGGVGDEDDPIINMFGTSEEDY